MPAGRPRVVDPEELYFFAQEFYWDIKALAEGRTRWGFDRRKLNRTIAESEKKPLNKQERIMLMNQAEEQVRAGQLHESQKQDWLREKEGDYLWMQRQNERSAAVEEARREIPVPGEPEVLAALLVARTPQQVREICKGAVAYRKVQIEGVDKEVRVANWPIVSGSGSMFPQYLAQYAEQFIDAKRDSRFPRSNRPTSLRKKLWFLSSALAGALFGIKTRTAINLLKSERPGQAFERSSAGAANHKEPSAKK